MDLNSLIYIERLNTFVRGGVLGLGTPKIKHAPASDELPMKVVPYLSKILLKIFFSTLIRKPQRHCRVLSVLEYQLCLLQLNG